VKVLPKELTGGVNVDRFRREIVLAAQLQHPHIVTLLSTGQVAGVPYYTMPYEEGRSLRAHLREHGSCRSPRWSACSATWRRRCRSRTSAV
jgi:serine/threonine-protein kinase